MKKVFIGLFLLGHIVVAQAQEGAAVQQAQQAQQATAPQQERTYLAQNDEQELQAGKLYFFAHSMCQSCRNAYIYFEEKYADRNIQITDMRDKHNLDLYKQCVKKFNIKNSELRLPLICMGEHYIMGWTDADEAKFDTYLADFEGK